ncbi:hypothetical protein [Micromonospora sp. NPDC047730]|uniref:hypothetical protein n=1 Tax=Micromonospora sp. NPDC047730 TaxID=3364253 RepID=UPI00371577C8
MSYRDWGRDDGPPERPPAVAWEGPPDPSPADPYDGDTARPRARRRRRGITAGQQESVDPYLPRWALESGVRRADGGGRHAAPDDEDDLDRRRAGGGWRTMETTSSWHRVSEPSWREAPDPPASAPRSPVVSHTAPRPRMAPRRRASEPVAPSRASTSAAVRRRVEAAGAGAWSRRVEDDLLDADPGGPWRPLLYTAACYVVPGALIFAWLLTLDGQALAGCVTDISGGAATRRGHGRWVPWRQACRDSGWRWPAAWSWRCCCAGSAPPGVRPRWRWLRRWSAVASRRS